MRSLMAITLIALSGGCSERQLYNSIQHNRFLECQELPESQYEACLQEVKESFESYQLKRWELLREEEDEIKSL